MDFRFLMPVDAYQSVTVLSIFQFPANKSWWALGQMGKSALLSPTPKGLRFGKMLGSGRGGFSMVPDFTRYALLTVWNTIQDATQFFHSDLSKEYSIHASETYHLVLLPTNTHGYWNHINPFAETYNTTDNTLPVVVLTRATIYWYRLPEFWQNVPRVQAVIHSAPGMLFSIGVGELPLIQQATISIWENSDAIKNFAYKKTFHKEVVHKTRTRNWYKEELFARFIPVATYGTYQGKDILESYFKK
ncbi:spheroidene monooxygenase [Cytophagaceae bacterium DM2B3-1]|uniref:Spheroidene monooxygenase n=1 Tax=Xanthocytophaga flava TaxID=3048013 RepID=A0ABT7CKN7_9BACT|nr:spheroidene monooxygenase [Xanthocytophaga flavus]MDJ1493239.1 spheroidene monooxygenase [Xanthocytophaga flavus]